MRIPNFFIIGAPKSGTTALYEYLRQHPQVFMPLRKEPNYFASDFPSSAIGTHTLDKYLKLFNPAKTCHVALGEASTHYLYSKVAIQRIYEFNPHAKLIAMVRNPIDLAFSYHRQLKISLDEDIEDFEEAWSKQAVRKYGDCIPVTCTFPDLLQYKQVASLGLQVERALTVFPRNQVLINVFDDFKADTLSVYRDVLKFLEIPYDGRTNFPRIHIGSVNRSRLLAVFMKRPPRFLLPAHKILKILLGRYSNWAARIISTALTRSEQAKPLTAELRHKMSMAFRDDIKLLADVLGRDLNHWLS